VQIINVFRAIFFAPLDAKYINLGHNSSRELASAAPTMALVYHNMLLNQPLFYAAHRRHTPNQALTIIAILL
jgi:hypothetical protein